MAPKITRSETEKPSRNYPATPFRMFEDFFNDWAFQSLEGRRGDTWTPSVDIVEKEGTLHLKLSIPGLNQNDIELKVEGQMLTVKGERKSPETEGYTYHQQECRYGTFTRSFTLPDSTDISAIKADYKNGVLTVAIPPKAEVKPRTIKVTI